MHGMTKEILTLVRDLIDAFLQDEITGQELVEALDEIQASVGVARQRPLGQKAKVIPLFAPP
jgi:hypothetical protein